MDTAAGCDGITRTAVRSQWRPQPVDQPGHGSRDKARIVTGVWNGDDPVGTPPEVSTLQPFNALVTGLATLSLESGNGGDVRIAVADQRGDGRPDALSWASALCRCCDETANRRGPAARFLSTASASRAEHHHRGRLGGPDHQHRSNGDHRHRSTLCRWRYWK